MPTATGRSKVGVDMKDHDGLRGVAAVWIVIHHSFFYSRLPNINFQGSTLMPLFFLLSGFSMAIGYSGRLFPSNITEVTSAESNDKVADPETAPADHNQVVPVAATSFEYSQVDSSDKARDEPVKKTNKTSSASSMSLLARYFYNRFIRVFPVYVICTCVAIPPSFYGFGNFNPQSIYFTVASFVQSFIPTTTWTLFLVGSPIDGPGWTIATLYFFWLCFPWLLKHYQVKKDEELLTSIVRCFWIQLFIIIILFPLLGVFGFGPLAFWIPTAFPPFRLPIFIMGMNAGLLCTRYANSDKLPWFSQSGTFIPWNFWVCANCSSCCNKIVSTEVDFQRTCYQQTVKLVVLTFLWTIITAMIGDIGSNAWFQGLNVFAQLDLIVALARVKGNSRCSWVLRHPVALWYGELSMAVYLVHEPLIYYFNWFQNHLQRLDWPSNQFCDTDDTSCQDTLDAWNYTRRMKPYGIAIILPLATVLACFLYYGVEETVRKNFK